jgi:hypothetical protein
MSLEDRMGSSQTCMILQRDLGKVKFFKHEENVENLVA